jgi:hypothetical protein
LRPLAKIFKNLLSLPVTTKNGYDLLNSFIALATSSLILNLSFSHDRVLSKSENEKNLRGFRI